MNFTWNNFLFPHDNSCAAPENLQPYFRLHFDRIITIVAHFSPDFAKYLRTQMKAEWWSLLPVVVHPCVVAWEIKFPMARARHGRQRVYQPDGRLHCSRWFGNPTAVGSMYISPWSSHPTFASDSHFFRKAQIMQCLLGILSVMLIARIRTDPLCFRLVQDPTRII